MVRIAKMNMSLNVLLCFAFLAIAKCLSPEAKNQLMAIHRECATQTGISEETLLKALEGDISDDSNFKQHVLCVFQKIGFQNEAGELQPDVIKEKLMMGVKMGLTDETKATEILSKCINQKSTPEDTAIEMSKCMSAIKHS